MIISTVIGDPDKKQVIVEVGEERNIAMTMNTEEEYETALVLFADLNFWVQVMGSVSKAFNQIK